MFSTKKKQTAGPKWSAFFIPLTYELANTYTN